MKDEIFLKCMENSMWAQYIIEFFKFIGFSVVKEAYGDVASNEKPHCVSGTNFECDQINILLRKNGRNADTVITRLTKKKTVNEIIVYSDEAKFSDVTSRLDIMNKLLDKVKDIKPEEWQFLSDLYYLYETYHLFYHLYNEGLLKYAKDYYNGSGHANGLEVVIKKACEKSKKDIADCYNTVTAKQFSNNDKYTRYAILFLEYKLNDLKYTAEETLIFSPRRMLIEINKLTEDYPNFLLAFYLAARICRSDFQFNHLFIHYIDKAIEIVDKAEYSKAIKAFLFNQKAKFYEEHNYSIGKIKEAYDMSKSFSKDNCFVLYKEAYYLNKSGKDSDKDEAITILKDMEPRLVDGFNREMLMPKRRIHGYKCCALLGNIEYKRNNKVHAEMYYKKAIEVAINNSTYFACDEDDDDWKTIFYMCMPLTPITRNLMRIYGNEPETSEEAEVLRKMFYKEQLERELQNYWKKSLLKEDLN